MNSLPNLDRSFLALSHPVRRAILGRLAAGPATVGTASGGLGVSKPAVTKHLKVLEEAGVVSRSVSGRTHVLRLEPQALRDASSWLELHRRLWEAKFEAVEQHLEAEEETMSQTEQAQQTYGYHADKPSLVKRLHRIEGQVRGIEKMVEDDRYCIDILTQISAVNTALESLAFKVLDDHVNHCVADAVASGDRDAAAEKTEELLAAVHRFARAR